MAVPEIADWVKSAEEQGWTVTKRKRGHLQWRGPDGQLVHTNAPASGSNQRGHVAHNIRRELERNGLVLDGPVTKPKPMTLLDGLNKDALRDVSTVLEAGLRQDGYGYLVDALDGKPMPKFEEREPEPVEEPMPTVEVIDEADAPPKVLHAYHNTKTGATYNFTDEDARYVAQNWPTYRSKEPADRLKRAEVLQHYVSKGVHSAMVYDFLKMLGMTEQGSMGGTRGPSKTIVVNSGGADSTLEAAVVQLDDTLGALVEEFDEYKVLTAKHIDILLESVTTLQNEVASLKKHIDAMPTKAVVEGMLTGLARQSDLDVLLDEVTKEKTPEVPVDPLAALRARRAR